MLYEIVDYKQIVALREERTGDFESQRVEMMIETLLVSTSNLELIEEKVGETEGLIEDRHKFQHIMFQNSIHSFFALYTSTNQYLYKSAYRDLRYIFEAFLIVKGLNNRLDEAEELWKTHRTEVKSLVGGVEENPFFDFKYIHELGTIKQSERDQLYDDYPKLKEIKKHLDVKAAHPLRIQDSYMEGIPASGPAYSLAFFSLSFQLAILREYKKTLQDANADGELLKQVDEVGEQILDSLESFPAFLEEYLDN
jgi:hypothetical protein